MCHARFFHTDGLVADLERTYVAVAVKAATQQIIKLTVLLTTGGGEGIDLGTVHHGTQRSVVAKVFHNAAFRCVGCNVEVDAFGFLGFGTYFLEVSFAGCGISLDFPRLHVGLELFHLNLVYLLVIMMDTIYYAANLECTTFTCSGGSHDCKKELCTVQGVGVAEFHMRHGDAEVADAGHEHDVSLARGTRMFYHILQKGRKLLINLIGNVGCFVAQSVRIIGQIEFFGTGIPDGKGRPGKCDHTMTINLFFVCRFFTANILITR